MTDSWTSPVIDTWTSPAVADAFRRHAQRVEPSGPSSWQLVLRNGKPLATRASLESGVLRLSAVARPSRNTPEYWTLLVATGRLPAGAKFTIDRRSGDPLVVVELRARGAPASRAIADACARLLDAERAAHEPVMDQPALVQETTDASPPGWLDAWSDDAPAREPLGDGRFGVDVESPRGSHRVVIERAATGVCCSVELATAPADATRRQALALFLLTAADALPLARGAATDGTDRAVVRLEMLLAGEPVAGDVEDGVMTLAAACAHFGPEARALGRAAVAAEYVAIRRRPDPKAAPARAVPNVFRRLLQGGLSHVFE
jgi:hypothetical protein